MRSIVGAILAGLILLGACGGDDDAASNDDESSESSDGEESEGSGGTVTEQEYIDALSGTLQDPAGNAPLDEATATCLATAMVEAIGVSNLQDGDVAAEDFATAGSLADLEIDAPEDAPDGIAAGVKDCGVAPGLRDGFMAQLAADLPNPLSEDAQQCVTEELPDDDAIADAVGADFASGGTEYNTLLLAAVGKCPAAASALILSSSPADIPAEARACADTYVADNAEDVADTFASGDTDRLNGLRSDVREACPDAQIPE